MKCLFTSRANTNSSRTTLLGLGTLSFSLTSLISYSTVYANTSSTDTIRLTVPVTCSMTATVNNAHTATVDINQYTEDIGKTTIETNCNDINGFAVYAIGYGNDTYGNNTMITPLGSDLAIASGTATSGNTSNWSMKLTAIEDTENPTNTPTITNGFDNYSIVPTNYTRVVEGSTNTVGTTGAKFTSTYATYVSPTQVASTYEGKVKYTLVHPGVEGDAVDPTDLSSTFFIFYNANGDDVTGTMEPQLATPETLLQVPAYMRSGYGFAGWNTKADGTGISFGPNETITIVDLISNGTIEENAEALTLYAMWVKPNTGATFQNFNPADHTTDPQGTVLALTDTRDNNVYTVAKLKDNNWWMIENLRLNPGTATITADNTNNPYVDPNDDSKSFANLARGKSSSDTFCNQSTAECIDTITYNTSNLGTKYNEYGTYYNWYTATAGNGTSSFNTANASTSGDICPKGWHLPTGGDKNNFANSDIYKLTRAIINRDPNNILSGLYPFWTGDPEGVEASKAMRGYPNNSVYSGRYRESSMLGHHVNELYWSSTIYNADKSFSTYLTDSLVVPTSNGNLKYYGLTVRCRANV